MKTGRDADQPGQYSSECCLAEIRVIKRSNVSTLSSVQRTHGLGSHETESRQHVRCKAACS
jgi:hypothetical protein